MFEIDTESALFYGMIILLALVLITLILLLWHSGLFNEIVIKTCKPCIGAITIAYKFARGPYKESGILFTEAHTLLPKYRTVGVYYDDPKKKESSRLRYVVGLIISENGSQINKDDESLLKEKGFSFATFPQINHAMQTTFPFKSTISIIVAVFRVYPLIQEYIETRGLCVHPILELYDNEKSKIYFIGPLEKQNDFHVPEIQAEEEDEGKLEEEDDRSSLAMDDNASDIRSDVADIDSDSAGYNSSCNSASNTSDKEKKKECDRDSATSSFEEIDEDIN